MYGAPYSEVGRRRVFWVAGVDEKTSRVFASVEGGLVGGQRGASIVEVEFPGARLVGSTVFERLNRFCEGGGRVVECDEMSSSVLRESL